MSHHWLIITFSWFGSVSLQYISAGGPGADVGFEAIDGPHISKSYPIYSASQPNFESIQLDPLTEQFYQRDDVITDLQRKRRADTENTKDDLRWPANLADTEKSGYLTREMPMLYVMNLNGVQDNLTANDFQNSIKKKRNDPCKNIGDKTGLEWTWKRCKTLREPVMPKRVYNPRFSIWGGKRSGQMIYKSGLNVMDKRMPFKIVALTTNERTLRDAMPFKSFIESLPKLFKPGHPYLDVNLKKDGKRKVKFSAWGGKRSPLIIGPIWTPASELAKDSTLKTILLMRKSKLEADAPDQAMQA